MSEALAPRGPDGSGLWFHNGSALAHRRLAIIDLSDRGAQPMVDDDLGLTVVFNGIIYNHRELRAELEGRGMRFRSDSDTEVLLKGWAAWGEGMLDRLAGEETERTALRMVRERPLPFPPEPLRWAGIQLTRHSMAQSDRLEGRRNLWLRGLDRAGMGFDF